MEAETFGRYKLMRLLGEGGMAKVYLAVLSGPMGFEKEVALKKIDARLTQDDRFVKALINEARLGGQLRHKNIVEVYEFNQVGEDYYLAMEYVNGWTLDAVVRNCRNANKPIPPGVVLQLAIDICRGLEYAHTLTTKDGAPMNLVHRDLKPGNVILSKGGDAKIMDFGIAKADSNLYKTTAADITKGTPIYMSPEQVTGSSKLSGRSDIFSMGSILHEILCLDVIFHGDNLLAIMHKVLQADIREALANVEERMPGLEAILAKAMSKKPEERYDGGGSMAKDLQALLDSQGSGPTVHEWLQDYMTWAPEQSVPGQPTGSGQPRGTESLPDMYDPPDSQLGEFTRAFFAQGENIAKKSAPKLTPTGPDGAAEAEMGELTRQFFQTSAGPAQKPAPKPLTPPRPTAPARPVVTPRPPPPPTPTTSSKTKKRAAGVVIFGLVGVIVLLVLAVGTVVVIKMTGKDNRNSIADFPDVEPTPGEQIDATEAVTGDASGDATEAVPEVTPVEPVTERATPQVNDRPTPAEVATEAPTPHGKIKDDPTEAATAATTNDPVEAGGTAFMTINAKPWATIYLDGVLVGNTPKKKHEISAGAHSVILKCGPCSVPQETELNFSVTAGETYVNVRNEFTP
jgi:eukaryotic-like serine/threonine-protein kinase